MRGEEGEGGEKEGRRRSGRQKGIGKRKTKQKGYSVGEKWERKEIGELPEENMERERTVESCIISQHAKTDTNIYINIPSAVFQCLKNKKSIEKKRRRSKRRKSKQTSCGHDLKTLMELTAVMRRKGGRSNPHRPLTPSDVYPQ